MAADEESARRAWFRREILPLEPRLRRYLRRIAPRDADIEDLSQDALVRVITAPNWGQIGAPGAFLKATARNLVYDLLRRRRVVSLDYVAELDAAEFQDEQPDAEAVTIGRDELRALARIVANLPPQCQRVFTLRKIYGLTPGEIAARLGLSVSTVEKHLVKALRICSEALARAGTATLTRVCKLDGTSHRDAANREAASWIVRLSMGPCSEAEQARLDAWLAADPLHVVAFERESLAWERTERLRALRPEGGRVDGLLLKRRGFAAPAARRRPAWREAGRIAAAAVLCIAVVAGGWVWVGDSKAYATAVGERRVVVLDDGTRVELNTDTRLTVRMTTGGRRVKLERGEALFEVRPDGRRPFVVAAEGEEVRGSDAAFNVRLSDTAVKVLVVKGRVQVSGRAGPDAAPFAASLSQGGVGVYGSQGAVSRAGAVGEADRALSWRYGAIVLAGEDLGQAAAEFNRYNLKQLVISDPSIAGLHLGGYFQQRDVEGFARALQSSFGVEATDTGQAIYLTRAPIPRRSPLS